MSEDPIHRWERHTATELQEQNRPGPIGDLGGDPSTYFMIASNSNDDGGEHPEIAVANLKSPLFKSTEHSLECFAFWFYFGVSYF